MKNDFDFIRDKIDNSGVNAPADMDEGFVMEKLDGIEPDLTAGPKIIEMPKKRRTGLIAGIAAAFVAVVALSVFGVIYFNQNKNVTPISPTVSSDIPLKTFQSYDEVKEQAKKISDSYKNYYGGYDVEDYAAGSAEEGARKSADDSSGSGSSGSSSGGGSGSHSETYKQVEGVDEGDIVKTDGKYLYIASADGTESIRIYSAVDKPERVAAIYPENTADPTADPHESDGENASDVFVEEMYLHDGKLIAVCMTYGEDYSYDTMAGVYDVSDVENIKLVDQFRQSGYYSASRMIGDELYLVSSHSFIDYENEMDIPVCYRGGEKQEIPIENVYSVEDPTEAAMLIVGGFDLKNGSKDVQSSALIGTVENVYCNENNMFIYTTKWTNNTIVDYGFSERYVSKQREPITTQIYKVSLKDGIAFTAYGEVEGWLDSRYSLDEKDGYLRVAATVENAVYEESNVLYILDKDLKEVGSVKGIAENESIKAVRYVGDVAYVITYEQTDPLFVIDVSDPTNPTVLGEVKIDGFSTMLVPIDENTVLGIGVYTEDVYNIDMQVQNGVKLALFDVSDKLHPKVLDEKAYPRYDSDVIYEPRALVFNPDRGDYLIPLNGEFLVELKADGKAVTDESGHQRFGYSGGALNFKVENGKLVEIDLPQFTDASSEGVRINRCLYVGDTYYLIANGYYSETAVYAVKYQ